MSLGVQCSAVNIDMKCSEQFPNFCVDRLYILQQRLKLVPSEGKIS